MIQVSADKEAGIVHIKVLDELEDDDFEDRAGPVVDEMIANQGQIKGLILDATGFEGWDDFDALKAHFKFVKEHHKLIRRVAVIGNRSWQALAPKIASLFVKAELEYFPEQDQAKAEAWAKAD